MFGQRNNEIKQFLSYLYCTYLLVLGHHSDWYSQVSYWSGRLAPRWTPFQAPDSFLLHLVHLWAQHWSIHTAKETHIQYFEFTFSIKCKEVNITYLDSLINVNASPSRTEKQDTFSISQNASIILIQVYLWNQRFINTSQGNPILPQITHTACPGNVMGRPMNTLNIKNICTMVNTKCSKFK